MGALTATVPTTGGVAWTPTAVSASDTINISQMGAIGAYLVVLNGGGSSDTVGRSDAGFTPAGGAAAAFTNAVANATTEVMFIPRAAADLNSGNVTVTHTFTTSVTCIVLPC